MMQASLKIKSVMVLLFALIFSNTLYAEYKVADLQTLFTDSKQRAEIDTLRSGVSKQPVLRKQIKQVKQTKKIKVSGYMIRSDGKSVVWINNKNTLDSSKIGNIKVHHDSVGKNNKVTVTVDGKRKRLKPGETWHKRTGKTVDH